VVTALVTRARNGDRQAWDALAAAESAADPVALVDALRARQLACCAPEGLAERIVLACWVRAGFAAMALS